MRVNHVDLASSEVLTPYSVHRIRLGRGELMCMCRHLRLIFNVPHVCMCARATLSDRPTRQVQRVIARDHAVAVETGAIIVPMLVMRTPVAVGGSTPTDTPRVCELDFRCSLVDLLCASVCALPLHLYQCGISHSLCV